MNLSILESYQKKMFDLKMSTKITEKQKEKKMIKHMNKSLPLYKKVLKDINYHKIMYFNKLQFDDWALLDITDSDKHAIGDQLC